ncbi:tol-pal system protein YbgF [Solemya pervernicosa gill symbiont]|uniref:Cell division coordinator CpoB n=2 Tax=Gammaproteobacteria incertae sedis TaxID=118884 RepID=A0A1T2L4U2_9GAMM|nr:tol-pal system protein YbgF [Candidatus Reidiella endopervernicosa]OOZ40127.1 tol-pal system protein YbgF [Solemya pervernicosa gill symbiont]QKQ27462.1 tol-pal system protein YbgF [Candidatus Reidiella endopervernicosa]
MSILDRKPVYALLLAAAFSQSAIAAPVEPVTNNGLEVRMQRLERVLESSALLNMRSSLQQLQSEVQQLRGDLEQQNFELERLKKRQQELYLDIDRRLQARPTAVAPTLPTPPVARPGMPMIGPSLTQPASPSVAQPMAPALPMTTPQPALSTNPSMALQPQATVPSQGEQIAYQRAFGLLKEGNYRQAIGAFTSQLNAFPRGNYADNARYWMGEAYYVMRDFTPALAEFSKVQSEFPSSAKVADATLKIGYIRYELKEYDEARRVLDSVKSRYPGSRSARLADKRLQQMLREGR